MIIRLTQVEHTYDTHEHRHTPNVNNNDNDNVYNNIASNNNNNNSHNNTNITHNNASYAGFGIRTRMRLRCLNTAWRITLRNIVIFITPTIRVIIPGVARRIRPIPSSIARLIFLIQTLKLNSTHKRSDNN